MPKNKRPTLYEIAQGPSRVSTVDDIEAEIIQEDRELAREARRLRLEEIVERRKQKLNKLKGTEASNKQIAQVGNQFLTGLMQMAQVDPDRAKKFLEDLSQDDIAKLSMLSASGQGGGASMQALMPFLKNKDTSIQDIISIVKMVQPPQSAAKPLSVGDIAALFKVMQENKGQASDNSYMTKLIERTLDESKSYRELLFKQNQDKLEKEILDIKNRPSFAQELANKKAELESLRDAFGGGGAPNVEIAKMKMDQDRWMFEQKYQRDKDYQIMQNQRASEKERNKLIEKIAVPAINKLAPMVDAAVNAGKRKMSNIGIPATATATPTATVDDFHFLCPNCLKTNKRSLIDATGMPDIVKCDVCGTEFPKNR